jgi:hypothetical protein
MNTPDPFRTHASAIAQQDAARDGAYGNVWRALEREFGWQEANAIYARIVWQLGQDAANADEHAIIAVARL